MTHIVIPVHNSQQYLRRCLDSVASQTYTHWCAWLVENGSTDNSEAICREYAAADARFVVTRSGLGVSVARNHAIDLIFSEIGHSSREDTDKECSTGDSADRDSYGDSILFLDSDDELVPNALQILHDAQRATGAAVVISDFAFEPVSAGGPAVRYSTTPSVNAVDLILRQLGYNNSACGKLFAIDLFARGLRFWEGHKYEDLDFFYRAFLMVDKVCLLPLKLYYYRQHGGSFMHRWSPAHLDLLAVTERAEKFMADNHPELLPAARDRRFAAACNMLGLMHANGLSHTTDADRCWQIIRERRREVLLTGRRRLKNRLGAALTYLGRTAFATLAAHT